MKVGKIFLSSLLVLSGCIFAPFIDSFNQMGLSKADREKLLPKQIKAFQEQLHWGTPLECLPYVKVEEREKVAAELEKAYEGTRVVESSVQGIKYDEESNQADVTVKVRFYKIPFYVVTDRIEKQHWEFTLSDGWQYVSGRLIKIGS